jgi:hypothetical protein
MKGSEERKKERKKKEKIKKEKRMKGRKEVKKERGQNGCLVTYFFKSVCLCQHPQVKSVLEATKGVKTLYSCFWGLAK